jgi:hypothetical protein
MYSGKKFIGFLSMIDAVYASEASNYTASYFRTGELVFCLVTSFSAACYCTYQEARSHECRE